MSSGIEPRSGSVASEKLDVTQLKERQIGQSELFVDKDVMNDAFQGEAREHEMGVWEAVKEYPMACFWAFLFCFTIVCLANLMILDYRTEWS